MHEPTECTVGPSMLTTTRKGKLKMTGVYRKKFECPVCGTSASRSSKYPMKAICDGTKIKATSR